MEHLYDQEIQEYSNEVPVVTNGYSLRGHSFIYEGFSSKNI